MDTNTTLLERYNDEWKVLLKELKGDSKAAVEAEDKEYLWAAEGDDGFVELLLDSRETNARLQVCLKIVLRLQEREEWRPLLKEPWVEKQQPPNLLMKQPKLTLLTFDGNVLRWQEFCDVFNTSVHQQTAISNVTNFSYLKGLVREAAASVIYTAKNTTFPAVISVQEMSRKFSV